MKSHYSDKKSEFLCILDANNLYGWIMGQYLPYSGFKWLKQKEIDEFDVNLIDENSPNGYILEVDLNYSDDIHELHSDFISSRES